jgi:hypothetical protein
MRENLLECLIRDEGGVNIARDQSYIRVYQDFLRYFESAQIITPHDVVIGASFTYSWMPTILDLRVGDVQVVADILTRSKLGPVSAQEVRCVADMVNNSLVGASKLLHFVNPAAYAIWDSRVSRYFFGSCWPYQMQDYKRFQKYQEACQSVVRQSAFAQVHESINKKHGYDVTPIRAAEMIMYTCGSEEALPRIE